MSTEPAIRVERLRVARGGTVVLPELSCDVAAGSVTGLLGPSGSGKTTLIRAIVGVQRVAGGSVSVLGLPAGAKELRARVGYMTQAPSVYGDLTVLENLNFFADIFGSPQTERAALLARLLGFARLPSRRSDSSPVPCAPRGPTRTHTTR